MADGLEEAGDTVNGGVPQFERVELAIRGLAEDDVDGLEAF